MAAAVALLFASLWVIRSGPVEVSAAAAGGSACTVQLPAPLLIPLGTVPGGVVIDDACQYVYLTNPIQNRIEVFSLQTLTLEEPIQVGAQPAGLDITPDGTRLYVANSGGNNLSVVSLARRVELRKIAVPTDSFSNDRPYSIAIASNGKAYFSSTFNGSGFGGRVMELELATDQSTHRTDARAFGSTTQQTYVRASGDRSTITFAMLRVYAGTLLVYRTATNTFVEKSVSPSVSDAAMNWTGSRFLVPPGGYVFDAGLNQIGTIAGGTSSLGAAVDAAGVMAYRSLASKVEFLNLSTFLVTGEVALGDSVTGSTPYASAGRMYLSADGLLLAVTTSTGFVLVQTPASSSQSAGDGLRKRP